MTQLKMKEKITLPELEICTGDCDSVMSAFFGGATRVEMCSALPLGGLTPTESMMTMTRTVSPAMKRNVLIRPRQGDFLYSDSEFMSMVADMQSAAIAEADGFVIGMLTADGDVDKERTALLMKSIAYEERGKKSFTFHRAFDMTRDPYQALEDIIELGFDRILTSGCAASAEEGIPMLRNLQEQAAGRIIIMAGGGVTPDNARKIMDETGIRSLHGSCSAVTESKMKYRNGDTSMGSGADNEYCWRTTSRELVERLAEVVLS